MRDVIAINPQAVMVIKSTVPVGFSERLKAKLAAETSFSRPSFCAKEGAVRQLAPCIVVGERSARGQAIC